MTTATDQSDTTHPAPPVWLNDAILLKAMPRCPPAKAQEYAAALVKAAADWGIDTPIRRAYWLGQMAHESGDLRFLVEIDGPLKPYAPWHGRGFLQCTGERNYRLYGIAAGVDFLADPERMLETVHCAGFAGWFWRTRAEPGNLSKMAIEHWGAEKIREDGTQLMNYAADRGDIRGITRAVQGAEAHLVERIATTGRARAALGA